MALEDMINFDQGHETESRTIVFVSYPNTEAWLYERSALLAVGRWFVPDSDVEPGPWLIRQYEQPFQISRTDAVR